jgi:predicted phosphodiesterase
MMVCGHTHVPMVRRFERGAGKPALLVVNPGTLARADGAGFAIIDVRARRVEFSRIDDHLTVLPDSRAIL